MVMTLEYELVGGATLDQRGEKYADECQPMHELLTSDAIIYICAVSFSYS
jgi:hypothetical protein